MSVDLRTVYNYNETFDTYLVSYSSSASSSFTSSNDTHNVSDSYFFSQSSYENQDGSYFFQGETYSYFNKEDGNETTNSYLRQTVISDFFPIFSSLFIEDALSTESSYVLPEITIEIPGDLIVSSYTEATTDQTLSNGFSAESILDTTSFLKTFFEASDITEKIISKRDFTFNLALSQSEENTLSQESLYQSSSFTTDAVKIDSYYDTIYLINNTLYPAQIWTPPALEGFGRYFSATNFFLIEDIGSSSLNSAFVSPATYSYVFETVTDSYDTSTFTISTGYPLSTFHYTTSFLSSSSFVAFLRDGESFSSSIFFPETILSSSVLNNTGIYSWEENNLASYYQDISINTIFVEMGGDIILNNGSTLSADNFLKTSYQTFDIKIPLGGPVTFDGITNSSFTSSFSTSTGDSFSQSEAEDFVSFSVPAFSTARFNIVNNFVATGGKSPLIFDASFNRGFCAFKSTDINIYKNLLFSKISGGGDPSFENFNASINPFQESFASNSNFTSFIPNECVGSFMDSTFELTSGGTFYISSNGDLYNLGGTVTTINVSTNETLASIFTRNSTDTQILELKLSDTIERSFWTSYNTNSSYYQFSTNGKLVLYPGACYFLTIQRLSNIDYSTTLMQPTEGPKIIDFNERDGFAITTAPIFAIGPGQDIVFYDYVYSN